MTTDAGRVLARMSPEQISMSRMIVLDWYDGPREGFVEFGRPASSWYFRAYAQAVGPDGSDDLLFTLAALPAGALDELAEVLPGGAEGGVWVPDWVFGTEHAKRVADQLVNDLIAAAGSPDVVVRSESLRSITGVWQVVAR